jgi:hypothetical protein
MTFKNRITNIQPLAPGATATLVVGTGKNAPTLDKLQLTLGGTTFNTTHITAIRGFIDGRQFFMEETGTVRNARSAYLGLTNDTAEMNLDFTEPNARTAVEQNLTAIPLSQIQDLRFELDIAAGASANLTLRALAHYRAPTTNPFIKKFFRITQGFQAGGEQIVYLPNGPRGGKLMRVWIHEGVAGNITAAELRAKNAVGIEATRVELQKSQQRNRLVPQAGVVVLDFIEDGNLGGWFDTSVLADVELRLTGTAADTYRIYLEYADPIARL